MRKSLISIILCIALCLSFSVFSSAENDDVTPEVGDTVIFGHYEQDNDLNNGPEPIEWRVLEINGDKMFLLSKYVLDALPFNPDLNSNVWETCSLRDWLNHDFMNTSFYNEEEKAICLTEVDNSSKQNFNNRNGSKNTEDFFFLLSYAELITFFEDSQFACRATDYARPKLAPLSDIRSDGQYYLSSDNDYNYIEEAPWLLRSPGGSWCTTMNVIKVDYHDFLDVLYNRNFVEFDRQSSSGIRPAMWVDINQYLDLLPMPELGVTQDNFTVISCDESVVANTSLEDTIWKMWLPEGFVADALTESDIADHYVGYFLRDEDIVAAQYSDISVSLEEWQKEVTKRGFSIEGLYLINGSEAVLYRDEEADTMTASILDGKGKLLEVTFYPYSKMSDEADTVISSIQQEAAKRRLSGASGNSSTVSSEETKEQAYEAMVAAYKDKRYSDSYSYYEQAKGYQDADKYGNLLKVRLCFALNIKASEIEALEEAIVNDISFEDSVDVLVCNSAIAHYYLLGYWRTSNGMHGYEVTPNGGSTTTMPAVPKSGDYYSIVDGIYWSYFNGKWDERTAQYKFKPITRNQMEMYSYQTDQTFTFTKR